MSQDRKAIEYSEYPIDSVCCGDQCPTRRRQGHPRVRAATVPNSARIASLSRCNDTQPQSHFDADLNHRPIPCSLASQPSFIRRAWDWLWSR